MAAAQNSAVQIVTTEPRAKEFQTRVGNADTHTHTHIHTHTGTHTHTRTKSQADNIHNKKLPPYVSRVKLVYYLNISFLHPSPPLIRPLIKAAFSSVVHGPRWTRYTRRCEKPCLAGSSMSGPLAPAVVILYCLITCWKMMAGLDTNSVTYSCIVVWILHNVKWW